MCVWRVSVVCVCEHQAGEPRVCGSDNLINVLVFIDQCDLPPPPPTTHTHTHKYQVVQNQSAVSSKIGSLTAVGSMLNFSVCQTLPRDNCPVAFNITKGVILNNLFCQTSTRMVS